jgi:UDP-N-acetylmuramyl pentapeptide phosphotransferase/UDP-N-acetylglucosamine-1-phosphate transferase
MAHVVALAEGGCGANLLVTVCMSVMEHIHTVCFVPCLQHVLDQVVYGTSLTVVQIKECLDLVPATFIYVYIHTSALINETDGVNGLVVVTISIQTIEWHPAVC